MNTIYVAVAISSILFLIYLLRYFLLNKKVKELASKTQFSVKNEDLMKITFEGNGNLENISNDFNTLVSKYQNSLETGEKLESESAKRYKLDKQVQEFEHFLSQSNLISEIGRKITASLDTDKILGLVYEYVRSSMDIEELELLYIKNNETVIVSIDKQKKIKSYPAQANEDHLHGMQWTLKNRKEVFLNNAEEDYTQYFFKPVETFSGKSPSSVMGIPLFLNDKPIGSIGVFSMHKDAYSPYHLDFLKSISTYLSVALDNSNVYQLLESSKKEIEVEKTKSDKLLLNILPAEIAEELKEKGEAKARQYDLASILFTDFKSFTSSAEKLSPTELVEEINTCFKAFDKICEKLNVEKIKTIGDSYMAVGGLPVPYEGHITNTVKAGIDMAHFITARKKDGGAGKTVFEMRVGIHCGPVVAGIVGIHKFQYDLWGDSVNTASRMESASEVDKVNISVNVYDLIKEDPYFKFESRGKVQVKAKGEIEMYFVDKK
ncbi:MAG: class 3 adenylate cyclase [Pseudoalteromonas distincta]|jgi:class 3 adenylate cyclase